MYTASVLMRLKRLSHREPWSATLTIRALALEDVGTVCPVLLVAVPAPQHVDVLVMVSTGQVGSPYYDLPVSVPVARLGRPLTHSAQYTNHQIRGSRSLSTSKPPKPPKSDAMSSSVAADPRAGKTDRNAPL